MADQADDLSIPTTPARPLAGVTVPPRVPDPSRPGAEPANTPASSRAADLPRPGAEPAHAQISPRQPTEAQPDTQHDGVDRRTLIVGDDAAQKIATVKDAVSFIESSGGSRVSAQNTRDR